MAEGTKMLCVIIDEVEILIPGDDSPELFPISGLTDILIRYRNEDEWLAVHQTWVSAQKQ